MERNDRAEENHVKPSTRCLDPLLGTDGSTAWSRTPGWCISRQRCGECDHDFLLHGVPERIPDEGMLDYVVSLVPNTGRMSVRTGGKGLMPSGTVCPHCQGNEFRKETISDVWFDSGVSHAAVLETWSYLHSPADMYLDGRDSTGLVHSSQLESLEAGTGSYRNVLTHGFVVDVRARLVQSRRQRRGPPGLHRQIRREILRCVGGPARTTQDIRSRKEISSASLVAYRRIRNSRRFFLGNLYDFDRRKDSVAYDEWRKWTAWASIASRDHAEGRGRIRKLPLST
jgi:isoleucyl-tRNA synthetase